MSVSRHTFGLSLQWRLLSFRLFSCLSRMPHHHLFCLPQCPLMCLVFPPPSVPMSVLSSGESGGNLSEGRSCCSSHLTILQRTPARAKGRLTEGMRGYPSIHVTSRTNAITTTPLTSSLAGWNSQHLHLLRWPLLLNWPQLLLLLLLLPRRLRFLLGSCILASFF